MTSELPSRRDLRASTVCRACSVLALQTPRTGRNKYHSPGQPAQQRWAWVLTPVLLRLPLRNFSLRGTPRRAPLFLRLPAAACFGSSHRWPRAWEAETGSRWVRSRGPSLALTACEHELTPPCPFFPQYPFLLGLMMAVVFSTLVCLSRLYTGMHTVLVRLWGSVWGRHLGNIVAGVSAGFSHGVF